MPITPEDRARQNIDKLLTDAGWIGQDKRAANLSAGRGVAVGDSSLRLYCAPDEGINPQGTVR